MQRKLTSSEASLRSAVVDPPVRYGDTVSAIEPEEFVHESLNVIAEDFGAFAETDLDQAIEMELDWGENRKALSTTLYAKGQPVNKCRILVSRHRRRYELVCIVSARAATTTRGQPAMINASVTEEHGQLYFRVKSQNLDSPEECIDGHELAQYLWGALTAPLEYHSPARSLIGAFRWTIG